MATRESVEAGRSASDGLDGMQGRAWGNRAQARDLARRDCAVGGKGGRQVSGIVPRAFFARLSAGAILATDSLGGGMPGK
jgi:hypothetical protein